MRSIDDPSIDGLIEHIAVRNPLRATMLLEYLVYMDRFLCEMKRIAKPETPLFITIGGASMAGTQVDMPALFVERATRQGFRHVTSLIDRIPSRGMITKRHATARVIADEAIVWLKAPGRTVH
jgi:predicted methyltransferase